MSLYIKFVLLVSLVTSLSSVQSHNICNFTLTLNRAVQGLGFHKNISYTFIFENHSIVKGDKPVYYYHECIVAVQQSLPAGVYVDPDELEDLRRTNQLSAFPQTGVSTEAATPYARPCNAYMFAIVDFYKVETFLPVHSRYHSPVKGGGHVTNTIEKPSVYIRCLDRRLEKCDIKPQLKMFLCDVEPVSKDKKCLWREVDVKTSNKTMEWMIPVGDLDHSRFVEVVTFLSVVAGSMLIIVGILDHPVTSRYHIVRTYIPRFTH